MLLKRRALADAYRAVSTTLEPPAAAEAATAAATAAAGLVALAGQEQMGEQEVRTRIVNGDARRRQLPNTHGSHPHLHQQQQQDTTAPTSSPATRHRRALAHLRSIPPLDARFEQGGLAALPLVEVVPLPSPPPTPQAPAAPMEQEAEAEEGIPAAAAAAATTDDDEGSAAAMLLASTASAATTPAAAAAAATTPAAAPATAPPALDVIAAAAAVTQEEEEGEGAVAPMSTEEEAGRLFGPSSPPVPSAPAVASAASAPAAPAAVPMDTQGEGEGEGEGVSPIGEDVKLFPVAAPGPFAAAPMSLEEEQGVESAVVVGMEEEGKEGKGPAEPMAVVGETPVEQAQARAASASPAAMSMGAGADEGEEGEEQGKGMKRPHATAAAAAAVQGQQGLDAEGRERVEAVARFVVLGGLDEELFKELEAMLRQGWYSY